MHKRVNITQYGAKTDGMLCTRFIQQAIDDCFMCGGGVVEVPAGTFRTGSVRLRSNVTLYLMENARLEGSTNPEDYNDYINDTIEPIKPEYKTDDLWKSVSERKNHNYSRLPAGRWNNAIIRAIDADNISIIGEIGSEIDGMDCFDEKGEEHYRGPHAIDMHYCKNITLVGYTVCNSANWAHALYQCSNILIDSVGVIAGHDGVHITGCENTDIINCCFYTGDDCIAGIDNINTTVTNTELNTACSAFRFGGTNMLVQNCRIYGPAKYLFRGSLSDEEKRNRKVTVQNTDHRYNMLSFFTYYSDFSRDIRYPPGNIVMKNCTVENADRFLHYNFSGNEPWQLNKPLESISFENISATGVKLPLTAYGSEESPLVCRLKNCTVDFDSTAGDVPFMQAAHFERISLDGVTVTGLSKPVIRTWTDGTFTSKDSTECSVEQADKEFYAQSI
ncbi:MAG: hypothetical protein IJ460_08030 [Clostridia bacterium]|nr:hypothetical protein [Clostridia bacterium]